METIACSRRSRDVLVVSVWPSSETSYVPLYCRDRGNGGFKLVVGALSKSTERERHVGMNPFPMETLAPPSTDPGSDSTGFAAAFSL